MQVKNPPSPVGGSDARTNVGIGATKLERRGEEEEESRLYTEAETGFVKRVDLYQSARIFTPRRVLRGIKFWVVNYSSGRHAGCFCDTRTLIVLLLRQR